MRTLITTGCLVVLGLLLWVFPLFHIVKIDRRDSVTAESAFDAANFAKTFWNDRLLPSLVKAPDAAAVLAAFADDPRAAAAKFGRRVGVSRTSLVLLRGSGTIVEQSKAGVGVALQGDSKSADLVLQTGLVFGNVVRDASGLLDASVFSDSRQFNEISTELNRIVESGVLPLLKQKVNVGQEIEFVGCAEIPDDGGMSHPLKCIPLEVRID